MNAERFVQALQDAVVRDNLAVYADLFRMPPEHAVDPHWVRALSLFNTLDDAGKATLMDIVCQVMVETTANLLGIADGCCPVAGVKGSVGLVVDGHALGGELQELFLELNEAADEGGCRLA
ncbi:hypothetical protein [Luteibacter yeojuensis]|uniref:Uncharacterized protein n=1 Tax=Luteibacter yeojuensis TaxID=345309 RepID=A0A0F3L1I5_9GAMM|nr:hypothetical protein [Luteibacter yeojuensis]KJV36214.1 hypothetical protein VI08_05925 [Luteibacter yeojuensis]